MLVLIVITFVSAIISILILFVGLCIPIPHTIVFLLPIVSIVTSFFGLFGLPYIPAYFPQLGPYVVYRLKFFRIIVAFIVIGASLFSSIHLEGMYPVIAFGVVLFLLFITFIGNPPEGAFTVLYNPPHVSSDTVTLANDAMIVGCSIEDYSVAWPIEDVLIPRHIVNDLVGNKPILASFCAACRSAILYDATVNGQRLTFTVATVWKRNMLMRDKQTGTLWQQATGEAVMGPLKGTTLNMLGGIQMKWFAWKERHPETTVVVDTGRSWFPPKKLLTHLLLQVTSRMTLPGVQAPMDNRLDFHDEIAGIQLNGVVKAYPVRILQEQKRIEDRVADTNITLVYDRSSNSIEAHTEDGTNVYVDREWWLGWSEFHPTTTVYEQK